MKRLLRGLLYALILIIVTLVSTLTSMRFAIHRREVTVPKLVGVTPAEAQHMLANNGLLLLPEEHFYSSEVPEGRIVSQLPSPGTRVRTGYRIRVAESLGPQKVEIPDLIGASARAADLTLRRRGLELGSTALLSTPAFPADQVIAQNPTPDARNISSSSVSVLMSAPPPPQFFVMPDLLGSKIAEAMLTVRNAGLMMGSVAQAQAAPAANASAPDGAGMTQPGTPVTQSAPARIAPPPNAPTRSFSDAIVTHQNPAPGQRVAPGAVVHFEVTPR